MPAAFLAWMALAAAPPAVGPVDVLDYAVDLRVDRACGEVRGTERIRLRSAEGRPAAVVFPRNGIDVLAAHTGGRTPLDHWVTADTIEVRWPLAAGATATMDIDYVARAPRGVKFLPDHVYTIFFACHWMVCREDPADKATLTLAITAPESTTVVASGQPGPRRRLPGGQVRQVWREARPYSSYLYAFALGRFTRAVERHGPLTLETYAADLAPAARARIFADTGAMVDFFERRAGLPLPQRTYRQVVVDGSAAQEATSFSLLGRQELDAMLTDPQEDWAIAHELAHQFWGNLLTCSAWTDFWLNEGLTVFMVAAWKEQRWGRPAYDRELTLARRRYQEAVAAGYDVPLTFAGRYPSLRLQRALLGDHVQRAPARQRVGRAMAYSTNASSDGVFLNW